MRGQRQQQQQQSNQKNQQQQPQQKIRNELTDEQKKEIKDAFSIFEDGGIHPDELRLAMKTLGFDTKNEEVQKIMEKVDARGKNPVNYEQFLDIMIERPNEKEPEVEMKKAFKILCEDGHDKITLKSLKKICSDLGENITDEELQEMIKEADKDEDTEVGEEDFIKIMKKIGMY